jgi:hypothetical protein
MNRQRTHRFHLRMESTRARAAGRRRGTLPEKEIEALRKRPCLATSYHDIESYEWNPTLRTIFEGVLAEECALNSLRGKEDTLVEKVFSFVTAKWAESITLTLPAHAVGSASPPGFPYSPNNPILKFDRNELCDGKSLPRQIPPAELLMESGKPLQGLVSYVPIATIDRFPLPEDRNINMMPFMFGDKTSLPEELQCYFRLIEKCPYLEDELGKVGYLTVHESYVDASAAQRREGIHIEAPGVFSNESSSMFSPAPEHAWGMGHFWGPDRLEGGIFMASTVSDTCQVWDALVDKNRKGIVDRHGGCEHIRHLLGPGKKLQANELIWMTDCTPHEALPQENSGYRQFFRVVTSKISHWFADHCTPNSLVPLPDHVIVVHGSKFQM